MLSIVVVSVSLCGVVRGRRCDAELGKDIFLLWCFESSSKGWHLAGWARMGDAEGTTDPTGWLMVRYVVESERSSAACAGASCDPCSELRVLLARWTSNGFSVFCPPSIRALSYAIQREYVLSPPGIGKCCHFRSFHRLVSVGAIRLLYTRYRFDSRKRFPLDRRARPGVNYFGCGNGRRRRAMEKLAEKRQAKVLEAASASERLGL